MSYACPHCKQFGISEWQRLFLVPWRIVQCAQCGQSATARWSGTFWASSSAVLLISVWLEQVVFKDSPAMRIVISLAALGVITCLILGQTSLVPVAPSDAVKMERTPTGGRFVWLLLLGLILGVGLIVVCWHLLEHYLFS